MLYCGTSTQCKHAGFSKNADYSRSQYTNCQITQNGTQTQDTQACRQVTEAHFNESLKPDPKHAKYKEEPQKLNKVQTEKSKAPTRSKVARIQTRNDAGNIRQKDTTGRRNRETEEQNRKHEGRTLH